MSVMAEQVDRAITDYGACAACSINGWITWCMPGRCPTLLAHRRVESTMDPRAAKIGAESFWRRVLVVGEGCWLWDGPINNNGYGVAGVKREPGIPATSIGAHRLAYELLVGPIPDGLHLDHLCRNRACVRPDHLEPVTQLENMRRGTIRERSAEGCLSRTHCKRGHKFAEVPPGTARPDCLACKRLRNQRYEAIKRGACGECSTIGDVVWHAGPCPVLVAEARANHPSTFEQEDA